MNAADYPKYFTLMQDCAFATVENNTPWVRPMALMLIDGDFYITTGTNSRKVAQLKANDRFALSLKSTVTQKDTYINGNGRAIICTDAAIKSRVFDAVEMIKCYWPSPEDTNFTLLKLTFDDLSACEL